MDKQNAIEKDIKRKHPEQGDESSNSSAVRAKRSSPNDHILPSHPSTLQPLVQDNPMISPTLGFLPLIEQGPPTRHQIDVIDFMGVLSPPSPPQEAVDVAVVAVNDPPPSPPPPPQEAVDVAVVAVNDPPPSPPGARRPPQQMKSETIVPPFPWATNKRAVVHDINYLLKNRLHTITGDVFCKKCNHKFTIGYNLVEKFKEVWKFIAENKKHMYDRAAEKWMNPVLPTCVHCGEENSVRPVTQEIKKQSINWLFLLLGQLLGCCTLGQLKYFCKHTKNHRTGAKDRVLYLTYLGLCKQLHPQGPFDR